ncbi:MAG: TetR family transcriptional regulator [Pseudomonadota bacterium]|nr:TetR family transcriptional regulator [Pseudomonadota bacterium]
MAPKPAKNAKITTKKVLMDATLSKISGGASFDSLSLREVAKSSGVVPSAFYRHFKGMDELGLALIEESFNTFNTILLELTHSASRGEQNSSELISAYVDNLTNNVKQLRFLISEYFNGSFQLKAWVKKELQILQSKIATEIALIYSNKNLNADDLNLLSEMFVQISIIMAKKVLDQMQEDSSEPDAQSQKNEELVYSLGRQLRILLLGVQHWESDR